MCASICVGTPMCESGLTQPGKGTENWEDGGNLICDLATFSGCVFCVKFLSCMKSGGSVDCS